MRLAPKSAKSYHLLGARLAAYGRTADALEIYRVWLDMFPEDPIARHLVAACTGEDVPSRASDDYVREEFKRFATGFDANLTALEYKGPELIAEEVERRLGATRAHSVLDAGCGTGLCAPRLRTRAVQLVGVDLSAEMVDLAKQRNLYDTLVVEELTGYLRKHVATFDLIVSADTLIYFGDLRDVLAAAAGALLPDGIFVFTVESVTPAEAPAGFCLRPSGRYGHTQAYLDATLAEAGLVDATYREISVRKEAGHWVEGFLVSARHH
jgi:predicted TPR repeat methyltransferase